MTPAAREYRDAVLAELRAAGIHDATVINQARHPRCQWLGPDGSARVYVFPSTPSDHRGLANARADLRRIMRADGLITAPEPRAPRAPTPVQRLQARVRALEAALAAAQSALAASERERPTICAPSSPNAPRPPARRGRGRQRGAAPDRAAGR